MLTHKWVQRGTEYYGQKKRNNIKGDSSTD